MSFKGLNVFVPPTLTMAQLSALNLSAADIGAQAWCSDWYSGAANLIWNGNLWLPREMQFLDRSIHLWTPATSVTNGEILGGGSYSSSGTISHTVTSSSSRLGSRRRVRYTSAATSGSVAGNRGNLFFTRGSVAGVNGFFFSMQFVLSGDVASSQFFAGLRSNSAPLAGEPSAQTVMVAVGYDSTDTFGGNLFLMYNDASGIATKTAIASAPRSANNLYNLMIMSGAAGSSMRVVLVNEAAIGAGTVLLDQTITTDLPTADLALLPAAEIRITGTTAANLELLRIYGEQM
jgi:hypothetical protein